MPDDAGEAPKGGQPSITRLEAWAWAVPAAGVVTYLLGDAAEAAGTFLDGIDPLAPAGTRRDVLPFATAALVYTSFLVALAATLGWLSVRCAREGSRKAAATFVAVLVPCLASAWVVSGPLLRTVPEVSTVHAECVRATRDVLAGRATPGEEARLSDLASTFAVCLAVVEESEAARDGGMPPS